MPGKLLSDSQIKVAIPKYTKPDVLPVSISFNGQDFSTEPLTYGFFDPYLLSVSPKLVSPKGTTVLDLSGFGFVSSDPGSIKAKFGTKDKGDLTCGGVTPCVIQATYIDKNTIRATAPAQGSLFYPDGRPVDVDEPITVDTTVNGNAFTDNGLTVRYFREPTFKSVSKNTVPGNLKHPIFVDTDFHWDVNDLDHFTKDGNFTCKYTVGDEVETTQGRMETQTLGELYTPDGSDSDVKPTHIVCSSPKMHNSGKGKL